MLTQFVREPFKPLSRVSFHQASDEPGAASQFPIDGGVDAGLHGQVGDYAKQGEGHGQDRKVPCREFGSQGESAHSFSSFRRQ